MRCGKAMDTPKTYTASGYLAYCQTVCRDLRVAFDTELSAVLSVRASKIVHTALLLFTVSV